jgi:hypothetical protein
MLKYNLIIIIILIIIILIIIITVDFPGTGFDNVISLNHANNVAIHIHVFILSGLWKGKSFHPGVYAYRVRPQGDSAWLY